jgi:hypothetical protein
MKNDTSINLNKSISTSEATILHNNGKPIKTDLFEKNKEMSCLQLVCILKMELNMKHTIWLMNLL